MKRVILFLALILFLIFTLNAAAQVKTNKDKVLTIAVQGQIAPAQVPWSYITTWDGKPKLAIGVGGINYNLKIGEKIFGWASSDRATVGVAALGTGDTWGNYTSIGNEVRVIDGDARGEKGVVIGKFERYVLVHFEDDVVENLTIGTTLQAKASGIGLEIEGFEDVFAHNISPELLEKIEIRNTNGKLEVPVVKEIPAEIVG